jgi:O-antigen/teichoic acid export membrane protein
MSMQPSSRFSSTAKLLVADAAVAAFFGGLFWLLAARIASPEHIGVGSAVISAATLVGVIARLGMDYAIPYFTPRLTPSQVHQTAVATCVIGSTALALLFLLSLNFWLEPLRFLITSAAWSILFVVFTVSLTLINLFLNTAIATGQVGWVIGQDTIQNGGRLLLWLLCIPLGIASSVEAIVLTYIVSTGLAVLLGFARIIRVDSIRSLVIPKRKTLETMGGFALKNHGGTLLSQLPNQILPLLNTQILGAGATAVYSISAMFYSLAGVVHSAITSSVFAEVSRDRTALQRIFPKIFLVEWGVVAGELLLLGAFGEAVFHFFGPTYAAQGVILTGGMIACISFILVTDHLITIQRVLGKTRSIYLLLGITSVGQILLSLLLLPLWGLIAIPAALAVAQAIALVVGLIWVRPHPLLQHIGPTYTSK